MSELLRGLPFYRTTNGIPVQVFQLHPTTLDTLYELIDLATNVKFITRVATAGVTVRHKSDVDTVVKWGDFVLLEAEGPRYSFQGAIAEAEFNDSTQWIPVRGEMQGSAGQPGLPGVTVDTETVGSPQRYQLTGNPNESTYALQLTWGNLRTVMGLLYLDRRVHEVSARFDALCTTPSRAFRLRFKPFEEGAGWVSLAYGRWLLFSDNTEGYSYIDNMSNETFQASWVPASKPAEKTVLASHPDAEDAEGVLSDDFQAFRAHLFELVEALESHRRAELLTDLNNYADTLHGVLDRTIVRDLFPESEETAKVMRAVRAALYFTYLTSWLKRRIEG